MSGHARRATRSRRPLPPPDLGQHFIASAAVAARIVDDAGITAADAVLEPGAGAGVLTAALAARAAHVTAVELDGELAVATAQRFRTDAAVSVVHADATLVALPVTPFRVVGNPAFGATAALLRHLLDFPPDRAVHGLLRADLVVQWQVARHRATVTDDLLGATWAPWWTFRRGRRLPAALFRPAPGVDAAVLVAERRADPLLPPSVFADYAASVRERFGRGASRVEAEQVVEELGSSS
ncbi:MAG TPA: rRNA adenine N-6-methyltransferase family protein [Acidimicrobiia bacterium]|nr:rRNA adenine N-6-methyltransferase family protein [Acidimicrobiia bacterium]